MYLVRVRATLTLTLTLTLSVHRQLMTSCSSRATRSIGAREEGHAMTEPWSGVRVAVGVGVGVGVGVAILTIARILTPSN